VIYRKVKRRETWHVKCTQCHNVLLVSNMNKIGKISLIIFDMDGLMFDTERIAISAWIKAGKDFGIEIEPEIVIDTIGLNIKGTEKVFKNYFGDSFPFDEVRKLRDEYAAQQIEENGIPAKAGLYELLEYLNEKEILKAVATSTERERAEKYLFFAKIRQLFDVVVCGDEVSRGKPEPDIFLEVARKLRCKPNECIVLEDSENGLRAALKAKMFPILIPDIKRPSKEVEGLIYRELGSLSEVKNLLCEIL